MKLIKAEHPEYGTCYFSNRIKAAKYIGVTPTYIRHIFLGLAKRAKGWSLSFTEDGNILNKYIDPEK